MATEQPAETEHLVVFGLVLSFTEKRRNRLGALISRAAIKPSLMLGLAAALYLGWLIHLMEQRNNLHSLSSERVSTTLVIVSCGWALDRLGHALFRSRTFENWLELDDPKDEAMLISLLDRLFTVAVIVATTAGLMVTFGISTTAIATLLGGAGIGIGFSIQQISQNFLTGFMLYFNRPFKKAVGLAPMALKEPSKKSGGITQKYEPLIAALSISRIRFLRQNRSRSPVKCTTVASRPASACAIKTFL